MSREYTFALPKSVPGFALSLGLGQLKETDIWPKIPQELKDKMEDVGFFGSLEVTKEDLDQIDDKTWAEIMEMAGPYLKD